MSKENAAMKKKLNKKQKERVLLTALAIIVDDGYDAREATAVRDAADIDESLAMFTRRAAKQVLVDAILKKGVFRV